MMVMGVNDASQIKNVIIRSDEDVVEEFIKPEFNDACLNTKNAICESLIQNADIIVLFGTSLGLSDDKWWKLIGKRMSSAKYPLLVYLPYDAQKNPVAEPNHLRRWTRGYVREIKNKFGIELDDEILADRTENYMDLDDLVPDTPVFEEEDEESILKNNPFGASRGHEPRPSDDFESAFETEDIRSDEKPVSSMDVSDGMYEEEAPVEDGSSYGFDSQNAEPLAQTAQEPLEEEVSESVPLQDESFEGQAESADGEFDPLAGLDVDESLDGEDNAFESEDQFETEPELDEVLPQMEYEDLEFPADASIDDEIDIEPEEEPQVELPVEEEPQRFVPEPPAESASDFEFPEVEDITPEAEAAEDNADGTADSNIALLSCRQLQDARCT